jgi:putative tricarboxylic transport membrane protein
LSATTKNSGKHRTADLLVLLALASLVILYGYDTYRASTDVLNLILVLPVIGIVLVLCLVQFVIEVRDVGDEKPQRESVADVAPVIGLFATYVLTLEWLGFDIGTLLFMAAFLWMQGERRWQWLLGYSVSLSFGLAWFFSSMLPYPMPMLILPSAY